MARLSPRDSLFEYSRNPLEVLLAGRAEHPRWFEHHAVPATRAIVRSLRAHPDVTRADLEALRQEGSIPKSLGWDASVSTIWRPYMTQNIVFRASAAAFDPGKGFNDLFDNRDRDKRYYSILLNAVLTC